MSGLVCFLCCDLKQLGEGRVVVFVVVFVVVVVFSFVFASCFVF